MRPGACLGVVLATVAGAAPQPAWRYEGYRLTGDIRSSAALLPRNRAAAEGRTHLVPRKGPRLPWGAYDPGGRWLEGGVDARDASQLTMVHEASVPPPVTAESIADRSADGQAHLYRFDPEDTRSRTPWVFRLHPEAEEVELPLPPGIEAADTQVRLCPDASCAVMIYREPESNRYRRTGIWVPRLDAERGEFRRELGRYGPHAPGGVHQWVEGDRTDPLELVGATDGAAWLATKKGELLFVGPTGHPRARVTIPGEDLLWSVRDPGNWAVLIRHVDSGDTTLTWMRGGGQRSRGIGHGEVVDFSFGADHLAFSRTGSSGWARVEVIDLDSGKSVLAFGAPEPPRLQLLGRHLVLVEDERGVAVHRLSPSASEDPARPTSPGPGLQTPIPLRPAPTSRRRSDLEPGGVPWALFGLLAFVGFVASQVNPFGVERGAEPGRTITPSRPAGVPEVEEVPADAEGISFLAGEDVPPEAIELLTTFLYLRAADELRAGGRLEDAAFEQLRQRARQRVVPLWEQVFPGAAPATYTWLRSRIHLLDEHLDGPARAALLDLVDKSGGGDPEDAPSGRLAQLYKLHLLFIAASEAAGDAADLTELRGHVFGQALAVLRELQADRTLPAGFAAAVRDQARETLRILDADGAVLISDEGELDRRFAEAIATYLELEAPTCRVCGDALADLPSVSCGACDTPHHQDCWEFNEGCAVFACGGSQAG